MYKSIKNLLVLILVLGLLTPFNLFAGDLDLIQSNLATEQIETAGTTLQSGVVTVRQGARLNVRTGVWGNIIGKLLPGAKVTIVGGSGDWYKIKYHGGVSYVYKKYVRVEGATSDTGNNNSSNGSTSTPVVDTGSATPTAAGPLKAEDYGYGPRFQPVYDIVSQFCQSNQAYVFAAGHKWENGFASKTDCSGFTGSFYQKLAASAGINPAFPRNSWYPSSQNYKTQHTQKITSSFPPPDPRDLIKPGDIFVMNKGAKYGHIGVFMGYDKSGNPLIAHSTTTRIKDSTKVMGHTGLSGVRIERIPSRYRDRWAGIYRINGTDSMLDKLKKS